MIGTSPVASFDLDGTLIHGPFSHVLEELDARIAAEQGHDGIRAEVYAAHNALLNTDTMASYDWESIVDHCLAAHGLTLPFELIPRLEQIASPQNTTIIHSETTEQLERLRATGWRTVLLTNGWRRYQLPALRAASLTHLFDEIVTSDDVGSPKPERVIFDRARAGAETFVHIGDRLDHDVIGGKRAGAGTILLRPDAPSQEDDEDVTCEYLAQQARSLSIPAAVPPSDLMPGVMTSSLRRAVDHCLTWAGDG